MGNEAEPEHLPDGTPDADATAGLDRNVRSLLLLLTGVVLVVLLIVIAVFVLGDDDGSDELATVASEPGATDPATQPVATDPPTTAAVTEPPATEPVPDTEPATTNPPATDPPATDPPATDPPATDPPATGIEVPEPFGGIFDELDLFMREQEPADDLIAAVPDPLDDVFDCDARTPTDVAGPDISAIAATTAGSTATVSVLMNQSPTTTADEDFSFALLLQVLTQGNTIFNLQWEIHDEVETTGRIDAQGDVDAEAADITLDEQAAHFSFEFDPTDPIVAAIVRGFNTPVEGDAKACDEATAAAIDFPIPPTDVSGNCTADETTACLNNQRFAVQTVGPDGPIPIIGTETSNTAGFQGDDADGWVRVLNGCDFNEHFWVFAAAATGVDFELVVTDTATNETFTSPLATPAAAVTDTSAFATCP